MKKEDIKALLREVLLPETDDQNNTQELEKDKTFDELGKNGKKKVLTLTNKIKKATQGSGTLLKLSQVMDAAGIGDADDATDRSAIGKAVSGKPDADGKVRHLTVKQANAMGKIIDNPAAFN